jgi:hypothetical protein
MELGQYQKPSGDERGGNGGDEPPGLHPFVQGLLRELPPAGSAWPETQRKLWLGTAESIFKMIYKEDGAKPKIERERLNDKGSVE